MKYEMKTSLTTSLLFAIILLTAIAVLLAAQKGVVETNEPNVAEKHSCCAEGTGSGVVSENSLFQLESEWVNESDIKTNLKDFAGKPIVLAMIFASCTYACPIIVNDMKKIESAIVKSNPEKVNFVLISIDPERDTPKVLKEFGDRYGLDYKRWKLLTSNAETISELAAVLGFKYKIEADGSFSHSNIINIINAGGEVVFQNFGLNQDINPAVNELKKLL